eukprot:403370911
MNSMKLLQIKVISQCFLVLYYLDSISKRTERSHSPMYLRKTTVSKLIMSDIQVGDNSVNTQNDMSTRIHQDSSLDFNKMIVRGQLFKSMHENVVRNDAWDTKSMIKQGYWYDDQDQNNDRESTEMMMLSQDFTKSETEQRQTETCQTKNRQSKSHYNLNHKSRKISVEDLDDDNKSETFEIDESSKIFRNDDQVRQIYLSRLVYDHIWTPIHEKKTSHQTCIIFDWDDTLLCTTFLSLNNDKLLDAPQLSYPEKFRTQLNYLDQNVVQLLTLAKNNGQVYMVTNAVEGWIQESSKIYLPKTYEYITTQNITTVSARSRYEKQYEHHNVLWKIFAFQDILRDYLQPDTLTNLISIGDSDVEIAASYDMASLLDKYFLKLVKLKEESKTPDDLSKQLKNIIKDFEQVIVASPKHLIFNMKCFQKTYALQKEEVSDVQMKRKVEEMKMKTERILSKINLNKQEK